MSPSTFERDLVGDTSGHEFGALQVMAMIASAAVQRRAVLFFAALALFIAAMTGTMAFVLLIPVAFLVCFAASCLDGRTRQAAVRRARALPIRLPDVTMFSDLRAQNLLERLRGSRQAIRSAVRAGPRGRAFDVTKSLETVPRLEREVVVLATRIEYLARFLESEAVTSLLDDVEVEEAFARMSGEPRATALEDAVPAALRSRAQVAKIKELEARAQVLLRTADDLVRVLEGTPARITALQLRRLESCDGGSRRAVAEAVTLVEGFEALEEAALDDEPRARQVD